MMIRDFKHAWRVANEMSLVVKWHDPGETGGLIYVLQNQNAEWTREESSFDTGLLNWNFWARPWPIMRTKLIHQEKNQTACGS